MVNHNVDLSNKIVCDNSRSIQSPNEDGEDISQRTVMTPFRHSSLSAFSPYHSISTIEQNLESYSLIPGPSIPRPMPQPIGTPFSPPLTMVNHNIDFSNKIIGDNSGSTQSPNEDGKDIGQRAVVTPFCHNSLSAFSPYSKFSMIQQQLVSHNLIPGPSILRPMPKPIETPFFPPLTMVNQNVDLSNKIVGDNSRSSQSPNEDGEDIGQRTIVTPFHHSLLSAFLPYSRVSTIHQQLEPHNLILGPSIPRPMPHPSSIFSSLPLMIPSSMSLQPAPLWNHDLSLVTPWSMFTETEFNIIMGDKKLLSLVASSPKKVKRILSNRASVARSAQKKAQYITELVLKVETLTSENTTIRNMYNELRENHIAMETELRELKVFHERTLKQNQLLREWNGEVNAQLSEISAQLNEVTRELNQYRREAGATNMQQQLVSSNVFQQLDINHQQQRNPDFDDQI